MGFLNENDCLVYFAILGELSPGLSFAMYGLCQDFEFSLIISWLFQGQGRTYLATPFSGLKKTKYQKRNVCLSALSLKDLPYNGDSRETLDKVHVKYFLPKVAFMSKTVATFVRLNLAKRCPFTSVTQDTNVIVGLK